MDPFLQFPLPRLRSSIAFGLEVIEQVLKGQSTNTALMKDIVMTMFEQLREEGADVGVLQNLDQSFLRTTHDWASLIVAMAFYADASRRHAENRLREALSTEMTIRRSMSAGRSPSPKPPVENHPVVVPERQAELQKYIKGQSSQREKNEFETSSSEEDEETPDDSELDFSNQALLWNPAAWHLHLTDEVSLTTWKKQLRENFVECREIKDHPFLKAQAETTLTQLEELVRITAGAGILDREKSVKAIENMLTHLHSLIMHATDGREAAEQYKKIKKQAALPKAERMARKEAIRTAPSAPKKSNQSGSISNTKTTNPKLNGDKLWVPQDRWKRMTKEEREKSKELVKQLNELGK
eukprot:PhF_6_TR19437/c0_g1_i1/m.28430